MTWNDMQPVLQDGILDTLFMVWWSTVYTVIGGLILGVLLVLTDRGGQLQNTAVNKVVSVVVNIGRSLPFIILMIAIIPFTRFVVGTSIGPSAAVVPLAVGAVPFFARLVETSLREVDGGLVEAAQSMGGGTWTIVFKVLLPQALPSLVASLTNTVITIISYSAMAGALGAGGLGSVAITYGQQRYDMRFMLVTVVLIIVIVTVVQLIGDLVVRRLSRRGSRAAAPVRLLKSPKARTAAPDPEARTDAAMVRETADEAA
ncbi:ABC transporter permease [Streptomyces sp. Ru73]|uniref:methionine ABC transporter permease n=1 Tax=Streptomyces sp. Ru73 TaxID=2080748 RepID=UPI000CDD6711|nr:methionine ABC transporter permease [Streptomyces sp. Ru73]POX43129.1 ABC transporter permease [Streptomyces sp. Ru73]